MDYDPTKAALLHPDRRAPLGADLPWNRDAVLAECARLAYFGFERDAAAAATLRAALARFGYGDFTGFTAAGADPRFDAQVYATPSPEHGALIAFRGTQPDSIGDLFADANFLSADWPGPGKVHRGFWKSLVEVLAGLEGWLAVAAPARLAVTGHSLGAAHATLFAALHPQAELVSFGSPLVGDDDFAASFAGRRVRRFVDCLDLVTRVPPLLYRHLDGLHAIDHRGVVHPGGLAAPLADRAEATLAYLSLALDPQNCPTRDLADHAPINYVSALLGIRTGP